MAETRLIQGRYRLLDLIGRGGMGEVWRARDESLGRQVAVKCLKPLGQQRDDGFTEVLRERFRREARVAAALQHRGVTVVHDFGEDPDAGGVLYLVMELLEGRNLSQLLEDNGGRPLPVAEVVDIADQVAAALAYTHEQGIVHRDLKPANIMRLTDGTVKICDFGIARLAHDIGFTAKLTGGSIAMGTPHYMSPEQIAGSEVDHRSDLYSLGCVLYEIATGAPPFDLEDSWSVLVGHRDTAPRPPREHRLELPAYFDTLVLDLLGKTPQARPTDAWVLCGAIAASRGAAMAWDPAGGVLVPRLPGWAAAIGPGRPARSPRSEAADRAAILTTPWAGTDPGPGSAPPQAPPTRWPIAGTGEGVSAPGSPRSPRPAPSGEVPVPDTEACEPPGTWPVPETTRRIGRVRRAPASALPDPRVSRLDDTGLHLSPEEAAIGLARAGRWEEAAEAHRAVSAERADALGADHPDTLGARHEYAHTLAKTGRVADALAEYEEVAAARERTIGPLHPDSLAARQEIAYLLGQLGRHQEAHEGYRAVLAARIRTLGPDHADTLRCRHNLAVTLSRLGRVEESLHAVREASEARARTLGDRHPDTLASRYEAAYALGLLGRWAEALTAYQQVASGRARALGRDHPETLAARYEVGISLGRLGRSAEALDHYRALVRDRTRAYGAGDPETLRARHGLGVNLGRLGRWQEALGEAREVAALRERVLGPDHADTLISRREVAVGLGSLGRWTEALAAYRQIAAARERALGSEHPDTLAGLGDEAHCLERLGRAEEAAALYGRVAAQRAAAPRGCPANQGA